ncbi:uncharacterized protein LOC133301939 [Gastrolobium bilobum]|uniref:uncharacterized protein LOC133301939 n=1 Tax=Gastrolobium bilobum TaxID=150636 RepID=UPI002AAF7277|nr:uncharacterized protein LOC133301939 [Gastrolobium bilobum]
MTRQRREEEEEDMLDEGSVDAVEDPLCPSFKLSREQHKEDCKQWRRALIIKLLGKRMGARFLMARVIRMWNLMGVYEVIDMDNGYLVVRFQEDSDYNHVLHEGLWIVADHYLTVQRWRPLFNPYDDQLKKLAVWIRIPGLPLELYTTKNLWKIGSIFGRTRKIDKNSIRRNEYGDKDVTERARFARICVEVDFRKSFLSKFKIGERVLQVGYEGLHMICFACGMYGHRKDLCPSIGGQKISVETDAPGVRDQDVEMKEKVEEKQKVDEAFGSWMVVQKPGKGRRMRVAPVNSTTNKEGNQKLEDQKDTAVVGGIAGEAVYTDSPMQDVVPDIVPEIGDKKEVVMSKVDGGSGSDRKAKGPVPSILSSGSDKQKKGGMKPGPFKGGTLGPNGVQKNKVTNKGTVNRSQGTENHPPNSSSLGKQKVISRSKGSEGGVLQPTQDPNNLVNGKGRGEENTIPVKTGGFVLNGTEGDQGISGPGGTRTLVGTNKSRNGVGIMIDKSFRDKVVDVKRKGDRIILVKLVVGDLILNILSVYAPQIGLQPTDKSQFWEDLEERVVKKGFPALIRDIKYRFKIKVFALLETRIQGDRGDAIVKKLGFSKFFKHEAVGFMGGIWILWDDRDVEVEVIRTHHQYVHTRIHYIEEERMELATFVYGSPRRVEKIKLWEDLVDISDSVVGPWILLGDFNSVLRQHEKDEGLDVCWKSIQDMQDCLMDCRIADVGFKDPSFTWRRGKLQERVDRACANEEWNVVWPNKVVAHLPYFSSDHRPILVSCSQSSQESRGEIQFKFLAA